MAGTLAYSLMPEMVKLKVNLNVDIESLPPPPSYNFRACCHSLILLSNQLQNQSPSLINPEMDLNLKAKRLENRAEDRRIFAEQALLDVSD